MKLTVVKSQSIKKEYQGYRHSKDVVTDVAIAKKLRSRTTTVVSSSYVLLSNTKKIPLTHLRLASSPIAVVVGLDKEEIYVHEAILSSSSAFLKNALNPETWRVARKKEIVLRDADIVSFRTYVNWLYTGRFNMANDPADKPEATTDDLAVVDPEWTRWIQCYDLANFLQDSDCKDALIDMAIEKMMSDTEYVAELPNLIYSTSQSQSPSRKLVVDLAVNTWNAETIGGVEQANYPAEFLADMVKAGLRRGVSSPMGVQAFLKSKNTCLYHDHTLTNTPCYKVKRGV